jgi:uncharacterized repeat protein (TIGR03803 family)
MNPILNGMRDAALCAGSQGTRRARTLTTLAFAVAATTTAASLPTAAATPQETVLYNFNTTDGASPTAVVLGRNGNYYGVTSAGGTRDLGTVFELTPSGVLTTLFTFTGIDGSAPNSLIAGPDGEFFGTTSAGGEYNQGEVFRITRR